MRDVVCKQESNNKVDIWKLFYYFIIYSIIGFFMETVFAIPTKGVLESRQSFLWGPFCIIYGAGAIAMISSLKNVKNYFYIFFGSMIVGGLVEYYSSLICEIIFGVKWWDYTGMVLSIHGRTCLFYLVCWGILGILMIKYINPKMDRFIDGFKSKVRPKTFKILGGCVMTFIVLSGYITSYALEAFYVRISKEYNLDVANKEKVVKRYDDIYGDARLSYIIYRYFNDEKMIKTFPNLMIEDVNNRIIGVDSLLTNLQSYYIRLGQKE